MHTIVSLLAAPALVATPVLADTTKETPGKPCESGDGQGTGNPCNGNNGNPSSGGNVNKERVTFTRSDPLTIARPGNDRGAFVRTGEGHTAQITRTSDGTVRVEQHGKNYTALAIQSDDGSVLDIQQSSENSSANVTQGGECNSSRLTQSGNGNSATVIQCGSGNRAVVRQRKSDD